MPAEASRLGFEIIGLDHDGYLHSWHCEDYSVLARRFDFTLNDDGLFPSYYAAHRVIDYLVAADLVEGAAPVAWTIVALARVPNG